MCMASSPSLSFFLFLALLAVTTTAIQSSSTKEHTNTIHLHFYMHDDYTGYTGSKPTAIRIITMPKTSPNDTSPRTFGDMVALNNVLTEGPSHKSKHVGRAQGFAVRVAEGGTVSDLSLHLVFGQGAYNGSSLTVHGRIPMDQPVRESVVVGGTGHFRFAKGYMLSKNYDYNLATGGVVEIDVYVIM
ncbi:Dirigent protein [Rhynchospora pubera]|uniref:Dirigent protein n=2 Tax=Rhynchospora pubera TaxID=906938 RepID=A0AAV8BTG7_9POAL|nr:Dirigent protein [Rhynchospora pubera]